MGETKPTHLDCRHRFLSTTLTTDDEDTTFFFGNAEHETTARIFLLCRAFCNTEMHGGSRPWIMGNLA